MVSRSEFLLNEERFKKQDIPCSKNKYYNDYRATVGGLKKVLEAFDDDLNIGVRFDTGFGYTDINEIFELEEKFGLVILNCD